MCKKWWHNQTLVRVVLAVSKAVFYGFSSLYVGQPFQLWYASPPLFIFNFGILNDTEARAIHLTFAIFLAFTAYPAMKNSPRDHIPAVDWVLALVGSFSVYIYIFYTELAGCSGAPTTFDIVAAVW